MIGQGSPRDGPGLPLPSYHRDVRRRDWLRSAALAVCAAACLVWLASSTTRADDQISLRLRIAWGGGTPRSWQGSVWLPGGTLAEVAPLGMEADVPGSMLLVDDRVMIARRGTRAFDGLDLLVTGPPDAKLAVELTPDGLEAERQRLEIPLSSTVDDVHNLVLDEQQNRLIARRAPGDSVRVEFDRASLIFEPGHDFRFKVRPHLASLPADTQIRCHVQLLKARTETEVWGRELEVRSDSSGEVSSIGPVSIELPEDEGAYDVHISLFAKKSNPSLTALVRPRPLAQRKVQLLVLDAKPAVPASSDWKTEIEIDPANPHWWDRLKRVPQLKLLPGMGQGPLSHGKSTVREHRGQSWVQLEPDSWQAYPLPVGRVGTPHVLEVEYPSDLAQTLGISLVEPNAAGTVTPLGIDSGLDVSRPLGAPHVERHRIVFWPRTKTPLVLFTNRRQDSPAVFGKLRVIGGPANLPPAPLVNFAGRERLFAAYLDKPLFPENFGASEALDAATNRSLDDWETFYQGGSRLVEYLKYAGYNGAIISVACEGSGLYPSRLLQPTPKYDSGAFFSTGQDPVRKDVLEMLFLLFDREGLSLIPAAQFSSPLPELETLRAARPERTGLDLVDLDGKTWTARHGAPRGQAPYYNPLDSRVQSQMLAVAAELAERYGTHPAFGGLALQLGPDTYVQFPGDEWGADPTTLARFARETGISLPGKEADKSQRRAALLTGNTRRDWLSWRAKGLADLHVRLQQTVGKVRPDTKLYLTGADLFQGREMHAALHPTLPPHANLADALLRVGLDPASYAQRGGIVFPQPRRLTPTSSLAAQAVQLEVRQSEEGARLFGAARDSGHLFFHEPAPLHLKSFDGAAPFGAKNSHTWLATLATPAGPANRERFIHALAARDAQCLIDGGWMTPLGQEDHLNSLADTYRSLPEGRFQTLTPKTPLGRTQPVTVRVLNQDDRTFFYLVNDSPWTTNVELDIEAPIDCRLESLARRKLPALARQGSRAKATLTLEPYDLAAGALIAPGVRIENWQVTLPREAKGELARQVQQVRARANMLKDSHPMDVLTNAGFEMARRQKEVSGWVHSDSTGRAVAPDHGQQHGGAQSLRVQSDGPVTWVRSEPFPPPATGRLSVWVWLRIADPKQQPPLRLAVEGRTTGDVYYKFAQVGLGTDAPPLSPKWAPYLFQVDDLPPAGLLDLRVGFDLMGAGEVWIDDVQVFDAWFYDNERDELLKNIALADVDLNEGRVSDCLKFLDGYWPRFLLTHVPGESPRPLVKTAAPRHAGAPEFAQPTASKRESKPSILERLKTPFTKASAKGDGEREKR